MGCWQLCEWVAIPSLSGQDTAAQEYVAAHKQPCSLAVDIGELDLERLPRHPAFGAEVEREHGLGVVAASND